ncbi:MAG: PAQR family membrane homeostasis protein TrhA [Thermoguttaceae bacterium]
MEDTKTEYCFADELASSFTHALGGYLGAAAVVLLVMFAVISGQQVVWKVVAGSIFASMIVVLYSASTLYHAVTHEQIKEKLRACDQMAIYAMIAGSYTPFCLVTLRQSYPVLSWSILVSVWVMAFAGIAFKILVAKNMNYLTVSTYLLMGWLGLLLVKPLYAVFPFEGIVWLVLGGVFYTLGVVFYLWDKIPLNHTIWHLFVLAGTTCHFFCILFYVVM